MNDTITQKTNTRFATLMTIILFIKVLGYFSILVGGIGMIQAIKIVLRVSMTASIYMVYFYFRHRYYTLKLKLAHPYPFYMYCVYLTLGFASLMWTTNLSFSATQLAMTLESAVFAVIFQRLLITYNASHKDNPVEMDLLLSNVIFMTCGWLLIGMFVAPEVFYRHTHGGEVARLGGLLQNPNEVGMIAVLGSATTYSLMKKRGIRSLYLFMLAIFAYTTFESQSRSTSAAMMIVTSIFILQSKNKAMKVVFMSLIIALTPVVLF